MRKKERNEFRIECFLCRTSNKTHFSKRFCHAECGHFMKIFPFRSHTTSINYFLLCKQNGIIKHLLIGRKSVVCRVRSRNVGGVTIYFTAGIDKHYFASSHLPVRWSK